MRGVISTRRAKRNEQGEEMFFCRVRAPGVRCLFAVIQQCILVAAQDGINPISWSAMTLPRAGSCS